ncbi:MAG: hypothetical protein V1722_02010 [Candidatus Micrarchaeota archaeon]
MILRPKSLREMEAQLRQVPAEKRKVIVLVGRHPNEGSTNIAARHHGDWEKEGAVVIRIPGEWTPHYAAKRAIQLGVLKKIRSIVRDIPTDIKVSGFLEKRFDVPVVTFHGSCASEVGESEFYHQAAYVLPVRSRIFEHQFFEANEELSSRRRWRPNQVIVEYYFKGKPKETPVDLKRAPELRASKRQLSPDYLNRARVTCEDLEAFANGHNNKIFEIVLAHLSKTGLKPKSVRPKVHDPVPWFIDCDS